MSTTGGTEGPADQLTIDVRKASELSTVGKRTASIKSKGYPHDCLLRKLKPCDGLTAAH